MVLNPEDGQPAVAEPFDGVIVEIDMGDLNFGAEGIRVNGKSVILRGDFYPAGRKVLYGLISAPVTKFEFECPPPECPAQNLMAEADAEHR